MSQMWKPAVELSPLTNRYKQLSEADESDGAAIEMDGLYQQIVTKPIHDIPDVLEKLAFADHCIAVEHDPKEALNVLREVFAALLAMHIHNRSGEILKETRRHRSRAGQGERQSME